jgi:hypothetical protein
VDLLSTEHKSRFYPSKLSNPGKGVIKTSKLAFSGFELDNIQKVKICGSGK